MMRRRREDEAGGQEIAELAALADGSLTPERRAALEERVAASSELADRLAEQERAIALARGAAAEVEAPPALRARIDAQRRARRAPRQRRLVAGRRGGDRGCWPSRSGCSSTTRARSAETLPRRSRADRPRARRRRRGDADQDDSGWRIELDASGLPRLDNGRFYEAWLRNAAGVLVPLGTFNEGQKRHAVGGRVAERLPHADRHARAGRRRSGLVRREGARRHGRHRLRLGSSRPRFGARPVDGRGRGGSSPSPRGSEARVPPPCTRGR